MTTYTEVELPKADEQRFLLRMSKALYARLAAWAGKEHRSVNAQIVHVLEEAAPPTPPNGKRGK